MPIQEMSGMKFPASPLCNPTSLEAANRFLREHYVAEFNRRIQVAAA
jgi:hypothetical protein